MGSGEDRGGGPRFFTASRAEGASAYRPHPHVMAARQAAVGNIQGAARPRRSAAPAAGSRPRSSPSRDEDGVVAVDVAEGQRHDAKLAAPVLAEAKAAVGRVDEVLGDKGFDSDEVRGAILEDLDALPVIPNKKNRKEPWPWDDAMRETYKERNRVERDRQGQAVPGLRHPLRQAR